MHKVFTNPFAPIEIKEEYSQLERLGSFKSSILESSIYVPLTRKTKIPIIPQNQPIPAQSIPPQSSTSQSSSVMEGSQPNRMNVIVATRYSPLVLPLSLNSQPRGDYPKYLPRFNEEGEVTT